MGIALDTLVYARRLREAGFSEQQAEGQARALAAAMTDSLATKQDLREFDARIDARFVRIDGRFEYLQKHVDARLEELEKRFETRLEEQEKRLGTRLGEQEKRIETRLGEQEKRLEIRFSEQAALVGGQLADLERRVTLRLGAITVAGIGAVSALVKLL